MLRCPAALVFLALTVLLAPSADAHTRTRSGIPAARASARGLRRESVLGAQGSRAKGSRSQAGRSRTSAASARGARGRVPHGGDTRSARAQQVTIKGSRRLSRREQARAQEQGRRGSRAGSERQIPEPIMPVRGRGRHDRQERRMAMDRQIPQSTGPASNSGRSATPDDFLSAAANQGARSQKAAQSDRRPMANVAQPVAVVSVIRGNTDHPQLESIGEAATDNFVLPQLPNDRGRRSIPAPLYGSHEILVHQNQMADRDGLDRILNDDDLLDKRRDHQLVPIPESVALHVDDRLPDNRRFCRPWVAQFLAGMAAAHYARFHTPLQVNSAVRTVEFQHHLIHINGNAAPAEGDTASPHLTGQAIDIAKRWMPMNEIAWMRGYLLPLIEGGRIDVEEEFQQACFHISAYRSSAVPQVLPPIGSPGRYVAEVPGTTANALAWSAAAR